TLILIVIFVALVFEYINGFHDTANSIATVVSTKVLAPRQAVVLAAITNLLGALWGTAVAKTITSGLVDTKIVTSEIIVCALLGGIVWNLITWWLGLPSSSSHALVGGLCGACLAAAHNNWGVIIWSVPGKEHWWEGKGILWKVVVPMITSPLVGFTVGFIIMGLLYFLLRNWRPVTVNRVFGKLQLFSAAYMGFSHGTNDAQKTMGIIFLALVAGTSTGVFDSVGKHWHFMSAPEHLGSVPLAHVQLGLLDQRDGRLDSAAKRFEKASAASDKTGKLLYAQALQKGEGVRADAKRAEKLLAELAEAKFDTASIKPATYVVRKFKDIPESSEAAVQWLATRAENGSADAMLNLGVAKLTGQGGVKDEAAAKELFERAGQLNHPAAFFNLGVMSLQGAGVPKDEKHAATMFKKCIDREAIPAWIKVICAITMCAGTAAG
ncbi:MAG TPA: inorganic phosphate transporter, partial [Candidatus Sumerlaeota bacterium]|nr:inorganic phosphate transporter [Candidatus Sumerlaeota bacterium]